MPSKKHEPEEIIGKPREVEIMPAQGASSAEAWRVDYDEVRPHGSIGNQTPME